MKLNALSEQEEKKHSHICTDYFLMCLCTRFFPHLLGISVILLQRLFGSPSKLEFHLFPSCHSLVCGSCSDHLPGHIVCVCVCVSHIFCFPIR